MNQKQMEYLAMTKRVLVHLDSKPALWNGIGPITRIVDEIRTYVNALAEQAVTQTERITTGYTQDKDSQKELMVTLTLDLVRKLRAYAKINKINVLMAAVDYSETDLRRRPELDLMNRCRIIHDKGREYLPQLGEYQVTDASLAALLTAINAFLPLTSQRDAISKARTTITANINGSLDKLRDLLDTLDDLIPALVADTDFVRTYDQSRFVGGTRPKKAKPTEPIAE